jgi:anti-sigma28 factor (negative regulator of flagellin synthesis)
MRKTNQVWNRVLRKEDRIAALRAAAVRAIVEYGAAWDESDADAPGAETLHLAESLIAHSAPDGDVRHDRIAALRASIEAGTYRVSAEALADKIVEAIRS